MKLIDARSVHTLLDYPVLIDWLEMAHRGPAPETAHMVADEPAGGENKFVTLVGWRHREIIAVKMVGVFPGNLALTPPQASVQGLVCVFDATTGSPRLAADGEAMTFRKTAADSALGARLLAREDARILLVVGAGGLAPHMITAHRAARPGLERVLIWNRTHRRAEALAEAHRHLDIPVSATEDLDEAVSQADIISCVTMADKPLVRGALLKPGAHLDLVGAYLPNMRETDNDALRRAAIFVDTRRGMESAGDLAQPVRDGIIDWDHVRADFFDLCAGTHAGRETEDQITLCKNVGGAHLDLFTAQCLLRQAQSS
jgi:ornithine cyclodeaminase/alanine dehydrogenase-like protein (mu-crystallin family)